MTIDNLDFSRYQLGWSDDQIPVFKPKKGINEAIVREMSGIKSEEPWMLDFRLNALKRFEKKPMLPWFADRMPDLDFNDIYYYIKPTENQVQSWEDLPDAIKNTYERLGIPEAERKYLAGVTAQYESEVVFHRNREDLERLGVLFCDMDTAMREYPDLVRKYFGTVIPPTTTSSPHSTRRCGVVDPSSTCHRGSTSINPCRPTFVSTPRTWVSSSGRSSSPTKAVRSHYVEGCSAPVYSTDSLHSAVVELVALKGSRITYTTIQNWSNNVYNLVTKRARAEEEAHVEWIDGNIGSRLTMKYPSVYLMGPKASGEVLSVAYAGPGQIQDAGAKMVHCAPETTSTIISKSISKDGGLTTYRGLVKVEEGATGAKSFVRCDALLLDERSTSETKPYMEVGEQDASIGHEATVSKIGDDQLFYLMSRGLTETQAMGMIVNGFIEPVTRTLPMEYAVEWSRLIELQMEGSIG